MSHEQTAKFDTPSRGPRAFATTQWSLVAKAASNRTMDSGDALEELCRKYWPPLYHFARRRGHPQQDAEDLTQGFFADLLQRGAMASADANRGRFRTFLLSSFAHFLAHERNRAHALKRGGGNTFVSFEAMQTIERQWKEEPATGETPETIFDRRWVTDLLDHALTELRREYFAAGRGMWFDELRPVLVGGWEDSGCAAIAGRLHATEDAVRVAASRLRKRFRAEVRREVARTVADPADVDDEMRHLFSALTA